MENNEANQVYTPSHKLFTNLNTKSPMQKGNSYKTRTSTNISKLTEDIPRLHYKDKTVHCLQINNRSYCEIHKTFMNLPCGTNILFSIIVCGQC